MRGRPYLTYRISADLAFAAPGYAVRAANDAPERDPRDWRLEGRPAREGAPWVLLDRQQGVTFVERFEERRIALPPGGGAFAEYRLVVEQIRDPSAAGCTSLSELTLEGRPNPPWPTEVAIRWPPQTAGDANTVYRLRPGGRATRSLNESANLVAGTPANPSDAYGSILLLDPGSTVAHTFKERGQHHFFATKPPVCCPTIDVGGPDP